MTDDEICSELGKLLSDGNPSPDHIARLVTMGLVELVATLGHDLGHAERVTAADVTVTDEGRAFFAQHCSTA
jgi:hypothetical protein